MSGRCGVGEPALEILGKLDGTVGLLRAGWNWKVGLWSCGPGVWACGVPVGQLELVGLCCGPAGRPHHAHLISWLGPAKCPSEANLQADKHTTLQNDTFLEKFSGTHK